ncbi:histone acetyltransferase mst2, partial [Diplogelasinospora grovesii]
MADAQLMEEELQQSVMMMSEREAELSEVGANPEALMDENEALYASKHQIEVGVPVDEGEDNDEDMYDEEDRNEDEYDDGEDAVHVEGDEDDRSESEDGAEDEDGDEDEDEGFEDEDGEGEEDDDQEPRDAHAHAHAQRRIQSIEDDQDEDDEDDDDERVGAVKIKPGETDNEDDSDDSASSASISDVNSDSEAEWEEAAEIQEVDDDEESENGNANTCMFCKQDEDHDPGEEFEAFLSCARCGDNSHQQCARDAGALNNEQGPGNWKCPDCTADGSEAGAKDDEADDGERNGTLDADTSLGSRRSGAPKLARDLLPAQKGAMKPDSHSVFNQLMLDEDPMDGSRVLRKRKTSSIEADDNVIMALRKRRRNTADSTDGTNDAGESTRPRSLRPKNHDPLASIVRSSRTSIVVKMCVDSSNLRQILSQKPRGQKKRSNRGGRRPSRPHAHASHTVALPPIPAPFIGASYSQPFYSFYDKETDELKGKPYGGILSEAEADTSKTLPTNDDRRRFDEAKQKAEEEWRQRLLAMQAEMEVPVKKSKKASGPASQIECIEFGGWEIDTWYAAPYPEEYSRNRVLYICEFCLKYMNSDYVAWRHKLKCPAKHPPGDEIYRHGSVSVFEVDGRKNPVYCQNLCLLAKLFLGSKTLYYDVEPFLFYVLCEYDELGYHFVGYFSKEKRASSQNNVSCILTLPIHQRKGYGNLLIDFSYLLTRVEQKTGSPEKPLSDMGLVSYRNYWRLVMSRYLVEHVAENKTGKKGLSVKQISDDTGMTPDDVISALEGLRCLVKDPLTQLYAFRVDLQYCREYIAKWEAKKYVQLNPSALTWTPYVMGRSNATNFELGPALNAIAPREDDEEPKPAIAVSENHINGIDPLGGPAETLEPKIELDPATVLESTEPNETDNLEDQGNVLSGVPRRNGILVNGEAVEDGSHHEHGVAEAKDITDGWITQYKDVPPTRFEVFPPITGGSRRHDRVRSTIPRPPVVRTASSASRPKARRSSGVRRMSSASKQKSSSSSKRKSGGTGRGPGRWPKGTKKSDYGNADSGPGLPPAWVAERARLAALASGKKDGGKKDGAADVKDTVQVQSPTIRETKSHRRNGSLAGEGTTSKARPSPRSHSSSSKENTNSLDTDAVMADVDADGED